MVVHYLDLFRPAIVPNEANPVLVVDPDAVLTLPIAGQGLEVIAWERAEVVESLGRVELRELALRNPGDRPEPAGRDPLKQGLGVSAPEGPDHEGRL